MAAVAGKGGSVKIGVNTVANTSNWALDLGAAMLEITAHGDDWKEFIAGLKEWKASIDAFWDVAVDTNGQTAIQNAYIAGTSIAIKLYVNSTNYYSGTAFVSALSPATKVDDVVVMPIELQGSGVLSYN